MLATTFNLQGHRGARGLKPSNTLPSFEAALDIGVTSIETDLHLSRDGHVIVCHDPLLNGKLISTLRQSEIVIEEFASETEQQRFPHQDHVTTPFAELFARRHGLNPFGVPTLDMLIEFVAWYAGGPGQEAGKTAEQRVLAARLEFDLELKRVPGRPEFIGDSFDGQTAGTLEKSVVEIVSRHGVSQRTVVRSFDHRAVRAIKEIEPELRTAILIAGTMPLDPEILVQRAMASVYCPDVNFLSKLQVWHLHAAGIAVLPWTVNDPVDWDRLLSWGVNGITTDYPDHLALVLRSRGIVF